MALSLSLSVLISIGGVPEAKNPLQCTEMKKRNMKRWKQEEKKRNNSVNGLLTRRALGRFWVDWGRYPQWDHPSVPFNSSLIIRQKYTLKGEKEGTKKPGKAWQFSVRSTTKTFPLNNQCKDTTTWCEPVDVGFNSMLTVDFTLKLIIYWEYNEILVTILKWKVNSSNTITMT